MLGVATSYDAFKFRMALRGSLVKIEVKDMLEEYDIDKLHQRKLYDGEWGAKLKNKEEQEEEFLEKEFDFDKAIKIRDLRGGKDGTKSNYSE